jgi:putative nucleotidyltransferase with HDIG domain
VAPVRNLFALKTWWVANDNRQMGTTHQHRSTGRRWTEAPGERRAWVRRPLAALAVRVIVLLLPLGAAVAAMAMLSRVFRRPDGWGPAILWCAGITVAATVVLFLVDRLARRLLPLAALLKLSLAFPDQTPSRLSVALRAGSTSGLERRLDDFAAGRLDAEPAKAATTILSLAASLSAHDRRTRGHSERVRALAEVLAHELGITGRDLEQLRWAALLHDIGKLHVAQRVLNKPGALDDKEWGQLRRHPVEGERLIEPLRHWLGPWADAVRDHHERWDGTGYPAGTAGEEISYGGRVVAVVDAFETITATRPYKRPLHPAAAKAELARSAGSHFDPSVVRAFLGISVRRLRLIMGPMAWIGALPFLGAVPEASVRASMAGGQLATGGLSAGAAATGVVALSVAGGLQPAGASSRPVAPAVEEATPAGQEAPAGGHSGGQSGAGAPEPAATSTVVSGPAGWRPPANTGTSAAPPDGSTAPTPAVPDWVLTTEDRPSVSGAGVGELTPSGSVRPPTPADLPAGPTATPTVVPAPPPLPSAPSRSDAED